MNRESISLRRIVEEIDLYINEILTYSHSTNISIGHLGRMWNCNNSLEYYIDDAHPNSIVAQFNKPISLKNYDNLLSHINDYLGYIPSYIVPSRKINLGGKKYNVNIAHKLLNQSEKWGIYFDAKYDKIIDASRIPNLLYHISPSKHEKKITEIGLAPKTKNKMSQHPERIYLAYTSEQAKGLLKNEAFIKDDRRFTLYEINYGDIKLHREITFMEDTQYPKAGCYTYENIPPKYIRIIDEINID